MDFSAEAEAYDNRFPAITKVVLRKGAVEFNPVIPLGGHHAAGHLGRAGGAQGHAPGAA